MDRLEISLRMKAGRWLAGRVDDKGKPTPLSTQELADRAPLPENNISRNRLEEFEQLRTQARPMELEKIAEALRLPRTWFTVDRVAPPVLDMDGVIEAVETLTQGLVALGATPPSSSTGSPGTAGPGGTSEEAPAALRRGRLGTA